MDTLRLKYLNLAGYKSISSDGQTICFSDDVTILLGPNGAGKSNVISFFQMLNFMMTDALREFVARQGYARSLLYYGPERSAKLTAELLFAGEDAESQVINENYYRLTLSHAAGDLLIFTDENIEFRRITDKTLEPDSAPYSLGIGHQESQLKAARDRGQQTANVLYSLLQGCRVYQFHNTADTAKIRGQGYINDNRYLRSDGGNLAAFLFALQENQATQPYYKRIVRHIQQILPQFGDFDLAPSSANQDYIRLDWRDKKTPDYLFGSHQLSDGSLRFMALAALLLQPPTTLPNMVIIDEPELGLHPSALTTLAAMVKIAGQHSQILLSTQSPRLVDEFTADQIVIVERDNGNQFTTFQRLDEHALHEWLEAYSLSELWEKNVLGGLP